MAEIESVCADGDSAPELLNQNANARELLSTG
jgi:hypothetical protein